MTDERRARMGLAATHDPGDVGFSALIQEKGAIAIWDYLRSGRGTTTIARRAQQVDITDVLRQTDKLGARFLIPGDDEWPASLADLGWSQPVGDNGGVPVGLWAIGPADLGNLGASVAIVGSRASTAYGEHVAADWAVGLAERGHVVVSGGAYGIDACAHRGALAAGGTTVAVMAGGLGQLYPTGNIQLLKRVEQVGVVVSENPPWSPPNRGRFLVRNRLIAALSSATLIVEGALRSGAQNTVSWALSLGRPVMAAPGPVTSAMSVTPHRLIRNGEAVLVTGVDDILALVEPLKSSVPDFQRDQPILFDDLTVQQKLVHDAIPSRKSVSVDELSLVTGESALTLLVALAQLKQVGLVVETHPGLWRAAPLSRISAKR